MIYLASPYSANPQVLFEQVELYVANALKAGQCIYSPIVHCHEIAKKHDLPKEFNFWKQYNEGMLSRALELHVLQLPGWHESIGVKGELSFAFKNNIPVAFIEGGNFNATRISS